VFCAHCQGIHIEDLELFHPYLRMTTRLALYIYHLCQFMTVSEVARHLGLDWKTVKGIDKFYLERDYGQLDYQGLRILAVDEISVRKGQRYLTIVLDYLSGRVVFVGKERKAKTLERFFNKLTVKQRKAIEAIVMDMWDPFIKAVKKNCLKLESSSICSTWWPILISLSIRSETANIARPPNRTRLSTKVQDTCCLKTARTCDAKAIDNNSKSCWS
jgi:transposase